MDERNKGGGGVVKNRSSSGCLIVNKKLDGVVSGIGGSSSRARGSKEEKKRRRLTISDSSEDDELVKFDVKRDGGPGVSQGSSAPVVYKRGVGNHGEFSSRINDFDDVGFGRSDLMREVGIKRSKLDIYDFDEYDDFSDVEGLGMRRFYNRDTGGSEKRFSSSGQGIEFGSSGGSGKGDIIYKRKNLFHGRTTSEKIKGGRKQRFEVKPENPRSMGKEKVGGSRDEAIRLQGRNGVLKVMVKNKEIKGKLKPQNEGNKVVPRSHEITPKNVSVHHSSYSERRLQKRPMGISRVDEDRLKKRKALSTKSSEESDEESEDSDTSPKLQPESMEAHRSIKRGRNGGTIRSPEKAQPTKSKEAKVKRGSGTEKQLLREKIRKMLVDAGWTIDYRPRRGRDYSDAVYINPSGTAYWSIIKAYEALQKQLEEDGKRLKAAEDSPSFAPISDDVLNKLTRQTKKKMEKELKRKKREEVRGKIKKKFGVGNFEEDDDSDTDSTGSGRHDDRLSSFMKRSGKSFKGSSKEAYPNPNGKMSERDERSSSMSNSRFIHGRKSKKIGRCTLLVRNPQKGMDCESDKYVPYTGKRNLLSWLIDSGTVKLSEKVHYMNRRRTRIMLEGWITRDGIHCGCCSKILTVSKFEIHAASKLRQPFQNIYSSSGLSLLQCQVEAWNRQDESLCSGFHKVDVDGDDPNDDTCAICGDGGNLICCDGCPSTFHQNCLDIQMLPVGDWHCAHCSCKFCGQADLSGTEANDQTKDTVLTCSLCERKYHSGCVEEMDDTPVNANSFASFCGKKCQEVFERLQKLLGAKYELEGGLCWSLIRRTTLDSDTSVRGHPQRVEWNSKLAVALSVMDECFLPITDRRSGIHMIHNVLYNCGSNFTRLNYNGFYTAILEKGDEIICAASIRIRGTQFAEMPFIGTRHIYRRQGMCRRLFSAIESALCSLKVEKLIIPAISELMETWTTVFGFSGLGDSDKQEMKTLNMLSFPGTDMLQKKLLQSRSSAKKNSAGVKVGQHASMLPGLTDRPDPDVKPSSASAWPNDVNMKDKSTADVCLQDQCVSTAISNEIRPLVLTEGPQGTTSSAFLVDIKLNDCAVADDNEELHGPLDAADEIQEITKYLNDSPVKHDMEESEEHNVTQEAGNGEADVALPSLADVPMPGSSDTALLDSCLGNESIANAEQYNSPVKHDMKESEEHNGTQEAENGIAVVALPSPADVPMPGTSNTALLNSCLGNESIADVEHHNSPVKHGMEESEEHNVTQEAENGEADVALPSPADVPMPGTPDTALLDSCLGNESVADVEQHNSPVKHDMEESEEHNVTPEAENGEADVALPPPADVPMSGTSALLDSCLRNESIAVVEQHNLLEATHNDDITTEKPMIELLAEGNNIAHEGIAKAADVSSSSHLLNISDTKELYSTQEQKVEVSQSDLSHGAIEIEDPLPDSHDGDTNYSTLEGKVDHASIEASNFQPDSNVSCENPALEMAELDSCEISTENPGDVVLVNNIPISDDELHHPHDNGAGIANTLPISNNSFKASSPNDESNNP